MGSIAPAPERETTRITSQLPSEDQTLTTDDMSRHLPDEHEVIGENEEEVNQPHPEELHPPAAAQTPAPNEAQTADGIPLPLGPRTDLEVMQEAVLLTRPGEVTGEAMGAYRRLCDMLQKANQHPQDFRESEHAKSFLIAALHFQLSTCGMGTSFIYSRRSTWSTRQVLSSNLWATGGTWGAKGYLCEAKKVRRITWTRPDLGKVPPRPCD